MGYYTYHEQKQRIAVIILAIAAIILGILALKNCSGPTRSFDLTGEGSTGEVKTEEPTTGEKEPEEIGSEGVTPSPVIQEPTLSEILAPIMNSPTVMTIRAGGSCEEGFLDAYPEMGDLLDAGLGGAKIGGEILGDAYGDSRSVCQAPTTRHWSHPRGNFGIYIDNTCDGLPTRIYNGDVDVILSPIGHVEDPDSWHSFMGFSITLENTREYDITVKIRRGLLIEAVRNNVQNIVVRRTVTVHLSAYERKTVRVTAYCASQHRGGPVGSPIRITPFYLGAEESVFESQDAVWKWQETIYKRFRERNGLTSNQDDY